MKTYTTKELKELDRINDEKKKNVLMNWIDNEAKLLFRCIEGVELTGVLKFYTRYNYVIKAENQDTISILAKHAVLWIDRV